MKIVLPDNQDEITLETYDKFMLLDSEADNYEDLIFSLFTGIDVSDINQVDKVDYDEVINKVKIALSTEGGFKNRFTIDGVEFGMIPNWNKVKGSKTSEGGEYCDLIKYSKGLDDGHCPTLNRLIAVMYRPIIKKDHFNNYQIEEYNGTEGHIDLINKLPMSIVSGCVGFFLTLFNDLESHILASTEAEQVREQ